MSRLTRLSARAYGQLTPEQKRAVDDLEWNHPSATDWGEAKTILGWRRTREETLPYAQELLGRGLMPAAVADRLRISDEYLHRVLDPENSPRNRSAHAGEPGLTDSGKVIRRP
jgi:hypothetical protein